MLPKYPVFIPSKGRYESRYTMRALEKIGVPYIAVVEPQEVDKYKRYVRKPNKILVTPHRDQGVVVTRNFIWDYARDIGAEKYWTIDDNIRQFYRFNHNLKIPVVCGNIFRAMEEFAARYSNVPVSGMHYYMFIPRKIYVPPFYVNTRVYSNMLIETDIRNPRGKPYRWEGFYNEDTDLCLRILKDGYCTILFNAFLIRKSVTMTVKGGNTPNYMGDGRYRMAKELAEKHPDVARISWKWNRYQHHVDYSEFKWNRLKFKEGIKIPEGINEFGMKLEIDEG